MIAIMISEKPKCCDKEKITVFMKESLREIMGEDFRQDELPWQTYVRNIKLWYRYGKQD